MRARAARQRHPLHPALVHFPIACWSAVPVLDALYLLLQTPLWWRCSFWLLAIGTATALAAMAAGLVDLLRLAAAHPAQRTAQRHLLLMGSAWSVFVLDLLLRSPTHLPTAAMAWSGLAASLLGFGLLLAGAWAGAELVYRHGVGQVPTPEPSAAERGPA
ncbi:DUF2231 domain-containing protein [Cognatiluteimonas weifangensis]|uniref:DUF2231 domain-containing protein n=1 Tax=Cognatiluteimonas weifangensis TaxID=2303539 RepID=A0A372DQF7_9GAMM|nr:DUF2231 domain-containing protein [Luteimonas weifangensis]RFP61602.1 DUF2231 domain-containing protein [Luteimonas weifangensis]